MISASLLYSMALGYLPREENELAREWQQLCTPSLAPFCQWITNAFFKCSIALFVKTKTFRAVDISSNLCGISGVKVWDP